MDSQRVYAKSFYMSLIALSNKETTGSCSNCNMSYKIAKLPLWELQTGHCSASFGFQAAKNEGADTLEIILNDRLADVITK